MLESRPNRTSLALSLLGLAATAEGTRAWTGRLADGRPDSISVEGVVVENALVIRGMRETAQLADRP